MPQASRRQGVVLYRILAQARALSAQKRRIERSRPKKPEQRRPVIVAGFGWLLG
jgi:hypothetical protein